MSIQNRSVAFPCIFVVMVAIYYLIGFSDQTHAAWSHDPTVNTPICTASKGQRWPTIASDGSRGTTITWADYRNGDYNDIYAQQIDKNGNLERRVDLPWLLMLLLDDDVSTCTDNSACSSEAYCEKEAGNCMGEGTCTEKPDACPDVWDPVCGCDGKTYSNACYAAAVGVNVDYEGTCMP